MLRDNKYNRSPAQIPHSLSRIQNIEDRLKFQFLETEKLFQAEERTAKKGQYYLLEKAKSSIQNYSRILKELTNHAS